MSVAAGCAQPRRALVQSPLPVNADGRCEAYPGRGQGQQSEGFKLATRKACSETTSALGLAVQVRCRSESVECLQENSGCANPTHRCVQQTDFIRRRAYPSSSRVDNQQCLLQWNRLKRIIMKDKVLRGLPFQDLWPRILTGFPELNVIGRLITVAVISSLPIDTSSNERYFRLMNQLMGKQQTSMKHELLRNLMTWHDANRVLSPEQWKLAITNVASAWLRADHTKTGKRVFRKDKLKKKGWVAAVEAMADMASVVENTYDDLVVARILE